MYIRYIIYMYIKYITYMYIKYIIYNFKASSHFHQGVSLTHVILLVLVMRVKTPQYLSGMRNLLRPGFSARSVISFNKPLDPILNEINVLDGYTYVYVEVRNQDIEVQLHFPFELY